MKIYRKHYRIVGAALVAAILTACAARSLEGPRTETDPMAAALETQKRAAIRMQLAIGYYQQEQYKVALEEIRQALLISPDLADAYAVRALIFMETGEKQLAEDNFLHALKLAPNNPDVANNFGWFLCQNGREKQGLVYLEKAIHDSTYRYPGKAYNNAGLCSLRAKNAGEAERYFLHGFREDPGNMNISISLAKLLTDRGEYEKARFYINRVLKADIMSAEVLWLGIRIETKLDDQAAVNGLATQLRRRYPNSKEYGLFQRGAFDE